MAWLYANQIDIKPSKWQWSWYLTRKTNDPDCNVVKLRVLLIEGVVNARENSVQIRKTNDPDWNVVKLQMLLFYGAVKVRENSVLMQVCGSHILCLWFTLDSTFDSTLDSTFDSTLDSTWTLVPHWNLELENDLCCMDVLMVCV